MAAKSSFFPNNIEYAITASPADVETPADGNATVFLNNAMIGNPLCIKDVNDDVHIVQTPRIAKGTIYDSTTYTTVLDSDGAIDGSEGFWLFVVTIEAGKKGEVWYKTQETGADSFAKVWDYVDAPHMFEVRTPASFEFINPNGTYVKQGNSWHVEGGLSVIGIITDQSSFDAVKNGGDVKHGMHLVNWTDVTEGCTSGDVWLKDTDGTFFRLYHLADAPATFIYNEKTYCKIGFEWAEAGSGSGGGGGATVTNFVLDETINTAPTPVRIMSDGKIKSLIEVIAGTGTGAANIGKPNISSQTATNQDLFAMAIIENSAIVLNARQTGQTAELIIGEVDTADCTISYGDKVDQTNYSFLQGESSNYIFPCGGIQWDADKVIIPTVRWQSSYYRPCPIVVQKLNAQQLASVGAYTTTNNVANTVAGVGMVRCAGFYGLVFYYNYVVGNYSVNWIRNEFTGGLSVGWTESSVAAYYAPYQYSACSIAYVGATSSGIRYYAAGVFVAANGNFIAISCFQNGTSNPSFDQSQSLSFGRYNIGRFCQVIPYQKTLSSGAAPNYFVLFCSSFNNTLSYVQLNRASHTGVQVHIGIPIPEQNYMVTNNPSNDATDEIYTFTGIYSTTGGYHMRMYIVKINKVTGAWTFVNYPSGTELMNSSECNGNMRVSPSQCNAAPIEGNGRCYIPFNSGTTDNYKNGVVVVQMDGTTVVHVSKYAGFLQEAGSVNDSKPVALKGQISAGHTGLSVGDNYYLDSDGELSLTASTYPVGKAIAADKLNLNPHQHTAPPSVDGYQDMITNPPGTNRMATDFYGENAIIAGGVVQMTIGATHHKEFNLPTSNPNVFGAKWNDNGTIKLSLGV